MVGPAGEIPAVAPLVQLKFVPAIVPVGVYVTAVLLQISGSVSGLESAGVGLTVILKFREGPGQSTDPLLKVGVTVIVPDIGMMPVFAATNVKLLPAPLEPRPIAVLLLAHV